MAIETREQANNQLRQSQVITTFGPGSMVDLPKHSVIVGGLEHWHGDMRVIREDRLQGKICQLLQRESIELKAPPLMESVDGKKCGVTSFVFPQWFLSQVEETHTDPASGKVYRTRPLVGWDDCPNGKYRYEDKATRKARDYSVVPVRFVQACIRGHVSDINWYAFVRRDPKTDQKGALWLDEGGAGNDFAEIFVRCERTQQRRPLAEAMVVEARSLGTCRGQMPWIGPKHREDCDLPSRLLVRSASNSYFSQRLSVIHIPEADAELRERVDKVFSDYLEAAESAEDIKRERKKPKVAVALEGISDDEVWHEVERRKSGRPAPDKSIKQAEIEMLSSAKEGLGDDVPEGDFFGRSIKLDKIEASLRSKLTRVVQVHRLREVVAQVGFTRFESAGPDADGELSLGVRIAPLAEETAWLPAYENRGEGVFIGFGADGINEWVKRPEVQKRGDQLEQGFKIWCQQKSVTGLAFRGLPYVMLHSLSHLLLTAISLECGYATSSIRERVYAGPSGYGILLFTGSPGSEGTLGGLVEVAGDLQRHFSRALEIGRLCSNDPICAEHDPANRHEERFLHGAACHGCLFLAETSCEARNDYLDRALVVPTVGSPSKAAFFSEEP